MKVPAGLETLYRLRLDGKVPSRNVSLNLGDEWKEPNWFKVPEFITYPEGVIRSADRIVDLDLRVFKGLNVFVHTADYTDRAAELFNALKTVSAYVCLVVLNWGDDFGIDWRAE